jgi:hypothetical protein
MITPRQFVDWLKSTCKPVGSSPRRRVRRRIVVEPLENRTSLSYVPVAAPAPGASLIARGALPVAAAHIQTLSVQGSGSLTPDGTGMVGPKDPGGVEL